MAPVYDRLSKLVYGHAQMNAQIHQLKNIPANSKVLIVGGGTGWILESIAKQHDSGLQIVYVEISEKMLRLAKARDAGKNKVAFVHADIEAYQGDMKFDVVLTPFLFCNFRHETAVKVFDKIDALLESGSVWLLTDFTTEAGRGKWWKMILLRSMYLFFKAFNIVEGNNLNDMETLFSRHHYMLEEQRFYYGQFILAAVYRKP